MQFGQIQSSYFQIDVGQYSSPQIIDLDADGLQDLVVGERDGVINFLKIPEPVQSPLFHLRLLLILWDPLIPELRDSQQAMLLRLSLPVVAKNIWQ